jgi:hypothetical protein
MLSQSHYQYQGGHFPFIRARSPKIYLPGIPSSETAMGYTLLKQRNDPPPKNNKGIASRSQDQGNPLRRTRGKPKMVAGNLKIRKIINKADQKSPERKSRWFHRQFSEISQKDKTLKKTNAFQCLKRIEINLSYVQKKNNTHTLNINSRKKSCEEEGNYHSAKLFSFQECSHTYNNTIFGCGSNPSNEINTLRGWRSERGVG